MHLCISILSNKSTEMHTVHPSQRFSRNNRHLQACTWHDHHKGLVRTVAFTGVTFSQKGGFYRHAHSTNTSFSLNTGSSAYNAAGQGIVHIITQQGMCMGSGMGNYIRILLNIYCFRSVFYRDRFLQIFGMLHVGAIDSLKTFACPLIHICGVGGKHLLALSDYNQCHISCRREPNAGIAGSAVTGRKGRHIIYYCGTCTDHSALHPTPCSEIYHTRKRYRQ